MADVRALLRQQRAARRIEHPHAAYSEAGKLLCTLCREQVRAESHWEAHIQSQAHKQRVQPGSSGSAAVEDENNKSESAVYEEEEGGSRMETQKRKHGGVEDDEDTEMDADAAARRKRSRPDTVDQTSGKDVVSRAPPSLLRRKSTTPSHGVEIQIPSRPTTPARRESSSSSTPGGGGGGGGGNGVPTTTSLPSRQASTLGTMTSNAHPISANSSTAHPETFTSTSTSAAASATAAPPAAAVDESEWAAFEADIAAASVPYDEDAVISRTAMTAEESAAAKEAAAQEADGELGRKAKVDVDIEDEREEAKRALEEEFDEMQELEARVQKLKEKREALRKRSESHGQDSGGPSKPTQAMVAGKENVQTAIEEDDEEDDEDTDDWDGFRFRTA